MSWVKMNLLLTTSVWILITWPAMMPLSTGIRSSSSWRIQWKSQSRRRGRSDLCRWEIVDTKMSEMEFSWVSLEITVTCVIIIITHGCTRKFTLKLCAPLQLVGWRGLQLGGNWACVHVWYRPLSKNHHYQHQYHNRHHHHDDCLSICVCEQNSKTLTECVRVLFITLSGRLVCTWSDKPNDMNEYCICHHRRFLLFFCYYLQKKMLNKMCELARAKVFDVDNSPSQKRHD